MKNTLVVVAAVWLTYSSNGCSQPRPPSEREIPSPTYEDVPYGEYGVNVLDVWVAESDDATPLAVYFDPGDKGRIRSAPYFSEILLDLLDAGISVAAVNLPGQGVESALPLSSHGESAMRFLQSQAITWGLDNTRVATFGGSGGAFVAMWLALKEPPAEDLAPAGSLMIRAVGAEQVPTVPLDRWQAVLPEWTADDTAAIQAIRRLLQGSAEIPANDKFAISNLSIDDPPIFMHYSMTPDDPVPDASANPEFRLAWLIHHVNFGVILQDRADELGVESHLTYPGHESAYADMQSFLIEKLVND